MFLIWYNHINGQLLNSWLSLNGIVVRGSYLASYGLVCSSNLLLPFNLRRNRRQLRLLKKQIPTESLLYLVQSSKTNEKRLSVLCLKYWEPKLSNAEKDNFELNHNGSSNVLSGVRNILERLDIFDKIEKSVLYLQHTLQNICFWELNVFLPWFLKR